MKKLWLRRLLTSALCVCLAVGGLFAPTAALATDAVEPADETTSAVAQTGEVLEDPAAMSGEPTAAPDAAPVTQYEATAGVTLKVRRQPSADASGNDSIAAGAPVYILEYADDWCKVDTGRNQGYVQTKYLTDVRSYGEPVAAAEPLAGAADTAAVGTDTPETFQPKFKAYAYQAFIARKDMDTRSASTFKVGKYAEVTVGNVYGEWSYIRYKKSYGYVLTDSLFKWDRIDPYAGDIPGCVKHVGLAFLNKTTDIRSYADQGAEVLKTVNPGTAVAVDARDEQGRYPLPYWRTTGYVDESEVSYLLSVVPWEDAKSGDLISCMSTFYAVGVHSLQYQGRNYNIYMATSFISGLVVQPNEQVNIYDVMGPYRKSTGYHKAPIMSPNALWGYGGGTCQVNTTLYNALIQVPILVNWRKVHAEVGIYYCPVGFDAAVGGGDTTMIFTNTLPYAVRINYFMSDGCLTVGIFRV